MTLIPLVISAVSLILSITVAWLTLFRRGTLGMTQPMPDWISGVPGLLCTSD